jgi:hypothetical protein
MNAKLRELLKANDENLFNGGACHIYALALKKCFPDLKIMHAGNPDSIGSTRAMHVYTILDESKLDVFGPANETQYLESKGYTAWEVSIEELTRNDPSQGGDNGPLNRWRHYLDPEFISLASGRARQHIEKHLPEWIGQAGSHLYYELRKFSRAKAH